VNIPRFVRLIRDGKTRGALGLIQEDNCFASICGRICPAPCEAVCVPFEGKDPVGIRGLERYASDRGQAFFVKTKRNMPDGKKIAVVGSGPAGLTAAAALAQKQYRVTVLESSDYLGGGLHYGIPEFRLPAKILTEAIREIRNLGIELRPNHYVGRTIDVDELFAEGFEAVLLASGAGVPDLLEIPGVNLGGVYYAEEFLMRVNFLKGNTTARPSFQAPLGQRVVVLGPGYTALDCARAAVRLGKDVTWLSPQSVEGKRTLKRESEYGREEGIHPEFLVKPLEILDDGKDFVKGVKAVRLDYADTHTDGKWELTPVPDSEFVIEADAVIVAMGHRPNTLVVRDGPEIKFNPEGGVGADRETDMTSVKGVFAAGAVVSGLKSVVEAMAAGKRAAAHVDRYLNKG
jgi:glutamate synthase (NADPH/NADH) small chain